MTTLYATDLDGTLLDSSAHLSSTSARMLRRLHDSGVAVTFITARTPATVEPILCDAAPEIPGVVMTGAALWHSREHRYEHVAYHRPDDVMRVAQICSRHNVTPFVYTLPQGSNSLVVYHEAPLLTAVEDRFVKDRTLNDLKTFNLHTLAPDETKNCTVLFFAMGDPDAISATAREIQLTTDCYASCYPDTYNPGLALLEVFTSGVSKADGLSRLRHLTGADRVVAFGDNLNDIPMLRAADVAVAVDNAHPEVKAVADVVIGAADTDAVVRYIAEREL